MDYEFEPFPKMARVSREVIITEKLDGTNAQVFISDNGDIIAGSRKRWITPQDDNFGFAAWVESNKEALISLGPGRHFGEWWGQGIQRKYGQDRKRFSLFNVERWSDNRPDCCDVVPTLFRGQFDTAVIDQVVDGLRSGGSVAAPGFMNPEGVIVFHVQGNFGLKKTLNKDEFPKSLLVKK